MLSGWIMHLRPSPNVLTWRSIVLQLIAVGEGFGEVASDALRSSILERCRTYIRTFHSETFDTLRSTFENEVRLDDQFWCAQVSSFQANSAVVYRSFFIVTLRTDVAYAAACREL